jgi:phosphate transport system permease protein
MGTSLDSLHGGSGAGGGMPQGEEAQRQVERRRQRGRIWLALFQLALIIAIVSLIALLYNILNTTIGLAAVQNAMDPDQLMTLVDEERLLALPNTTATEDDEEIAAGVAVEPNAVGFLGFAYFDEHQETLKLVAADGVLPSAASVESGDYPLSRPLYLYVNERALKNKPEVASFVHFYLSNVNSVIDEVGYFPLSAETLDAQLEPLLALNPDAATQATEGTLRIAGSSTLLPLTQRLIDDFVGAGFGGRPSVENMGTRDGVSRLCDLQDVDIANASRAMTRQEIALCHDFGVTPVQFRVASDALAVVVNPANDFVTNLNRQQAQALFGSASTWRDVDDAWPDAPAIRYVPGTDSGTLDFFVDSLFEGQFDSVSDAEMILILRRSLSPGVYRRYEFEKPMAERTTAELRALIDERVIQPEVMASWNLVPSLLDRAAIEEETLRRFPEAELQWWRWIDINFLRTTQSSVPEQSGVRTALLGSLWVIAITMLVAVPVGIGSAIYLEEYAGHGRIHQIIQTNIDNLAGVPSIIYGILGLTVFVRLLEPFTSGSAFGVGDPATANGRTVLSAGLTLALLVLPVVIINAQEAIRAVPSSLREAGYGLGATKWQVTWAHVLSNALPGIFTGTILAMSRALGETAPLIVVGASTFITTDPTGPFSKFTVLPMQIYQWTSRPQAEFQHIAAAASIVLIVLLLMLNGTAIWLRNRYGNKV